MKMPIIEAYLDDLIKNSTLDVPAWNIEAARKGGKSGWNYIDGCMILAMIETWKITGEKRYLDFAEAYIDHRVQEDGTIKGYNPEDYNIDNVNAGKTLFLLYDITGKEKYRKAIDVIYGQLKGQPRTSEGNFWHKKIYPNQVWLDGLYMGQPFYMEYETRFNDKKNYPDKNFWLRALGWYSMALLDTLTKADNSYQPEYDQLKQIFIDLMESMVKFQDESGMWYQVVNMGGREKNYLETSGSAIMAYSMLKGVRLGFLPESFRAYGKKAFHGICDRYLKEKDGRLSLGGICLVAGLGGPQMRDGTYEYYMSEPVVEDDAKGVGPFLLAYTEIRRLGE